MAEKKFSSLQKQIKSFSEMWGFLRGFSTTLKEKTARMIAFRIRLLPIVIFCAFTLLTVKVNILWQNFRSGHSFVTISETKAKEETKAQKTKAKEKKATSKKGGDSGKPSSFDELDPFNMTKEQYKVLQELSKRREEIEKREKDLPSKEATLKAVEASIDKKIKELKEAQNNLKNLLGKVEERENLNIKNLVKMAEGMKPKEAAAILEGMEFLVLLELMEKIKPAKAALILSNMAPEKASYLMNELAKRKKLTKTAAKG